MKKHPSRYALIALLALVSLNFLLWLSFRDYSALASENAKHLLKTYDMLRTWQSSGWSQALNTNTYPPLFYVPAALLYALLGLHSENIALLTLWPYVLGTAGAVFGLARLFKLPRPEALSAAFLTATALSVSLQEDGFIIEYAILALVTAALYLTLASNFLQRRGASLGLAVVCGLAALTKWTFISYLPWAILLSLFALGKEAPQRRKRALNWVLALLIFGLIAHTWYGAVHLNLNQGTAYNNFQQTFTHFLHSQATEIEVRTTQVDVSSQKWYEWGPIALTRFLVEEIVPVHLSILIIWGLFCALRSLKRGDLPRLHLLLVVLTFLSTLIVFTFYPSQALFSPQKTLRHLGPAAPLAIFLAMLGISQLKKGRIIALVIVNAIGFFSLVSWAMPPNRLHENAFVRPTVHGVRHLAPANLLGRESKNADSLFQLLRQIDAYSQRGYTPVYVFGVFQDYQPLLVELYGYRGSVPVAFCSRGQVNFLNGQTLFNEPDTPQLDLSRPLFILQDHVWRDGTDPYDAQRHDGCDLEDANIRAVRSVVQNPGPRQLQGPYKFTGLDCQLQYYCTTANLWPDLWRAYEQHTGEIAPQPTTPPSTSPAP